MCIKFSRINVSPYLVYIRVLHKIILELWFIRFLRVDRRAQLSPQGPQNDVVTCSMYCKWFLFFKWLSYPVCRYILCHVSWNGIFKTQYFSSNIFWKHYHTRMIMCDKLCGTRIIVFFFFWDKSCIAKELHRRLYFLEFYILLACYL